MADRTVKLIQVSESKPERMQKRPASPAWHHAMPKPSVGTRMRLCTKICQDKKCKMTRRSTQTLSKNEDTKKKKNKEQKRKNKHQPGISGGKSK